MSELADELFRETFASLRNALSQSASSPSRSKDASDSPACNENISRLLNKGVVQNARSRLEHIREQKKMHSNYLCTLYNQAKLTEKSIQEVAVANTEQCRTHLMATYGTLRDREEASQRRLRELIYELIGEYAKSFVRANRRYDLVSIADCKTMVVLVMQLRWKRFIYKFLSSVTQKVDEHKKGARDSILGEALSLVDHQSEIKIVLDALKKRLSPSAVYETALTAVVRFDRLREKERTNTSPNLIPLIANNLSEFAKFETELMTWISPPPRSVAGNASANQPPIGRARSGSNLVAGDKDKKSGNRLHELLQSSKIEWLCPSSHYPNIWDDILDEESASTAEPLYGGNKSAAGHRGISDRMHFSKKFSLQHTAGVASNRLYFCLEERYLWSKSPQSISADGEDEQKFPVLALLSYLQSIYARRSSISDDAVLAAELDGVLDVFEYVGDHRDLRTSKQSGGTSAGEGPTRAPDLNVTFVDLASVFPDVIRAKTRSGMVVHFAPAMMANLLETAVLSTLSPSSDYVRHICMGSRCPHPWLIQLLSMGGSGGSAGGHRLSPISRLYTICRPRHIPASSRPHQCCDSTLNAILAPPTSSIEAPAVDVDDAANNAARGSVFLVPLSPVCHEEILKSYFGEEKSLLQEQSSCYFGNAGYVLPDHSRMYYGPACQKGSTDSSGSQRTAFVSPSSDSNGSFYHTYILVAVQPAPEQRKSVTASVGKYSRETINGMISDANSGEGKAPSGWQMHHSKSNPLTKANDRNKSSSSKMNSNIDNVKYYFLQFRRHEDISIRDPFIKPEVEARPELQPGHQLASCSSIRRDQWAFDQQLFYEIMEENDCKDVMLSRNESRVSISTLSIGGSDAEQKKGWDVSVVSSLCRWRSCLNEASNNATPRYLCNYHADLKRFLDHLTAHGIDGSAYDSSKYLPKKPPLIPLSVPDRDLQIICMASPLLQEMRDGKLRHTVHSFVRKMMQDMSLRHRLTGMVDWYARRLSATACYPVSPAGFVTSSLSTKQIKQRKSLFLSSPLGKDAAKYLPIGRIPPSPSWAKWKNTELLKREIESLSAENNILQELAKHEQMALAELLVLMNLQIFPSAEIAAVRREIQMLKDVSARDGDQIDEERETADLENEVSIAERKAMLFRARRLDEERIVSQNFAAAADGMRYMS